MSYINKLLLWGGGNNIMTNFSYEEQNTGLTWYDGRPIYQRGFDWNNGTSHNAIFDTGIALEERFDILESSVVVYMTGNDCLHVKTYIISSNANMHLWLTFNYNLGGLKPNSGKITIWYVKP